ncbi:MAG: HDOD domain-containing protein [Candidatus Thiodiazotropha lotti]
MSFHPNWNVNANIPSPSPILARIFEKLNSSDLNIKNLAEIITADAEVSARMLRLANAAYSSPTSKISNVLDAIIQFGLTTTIHVITATEVASIFCKVPGKLGMMKNHWKHHILVASLAESIANLHNLPDPGRWFLGGLVHDIGRLMMLKVDSDRYSLAIEMHEMEGIDLREAEKVYFDYSHDIAGGLLLDYWRFPSDIADAAYEHHTEFKAYEDYGSGIGVADTIANAIQTNQSLPHYSDLPVSEIVIAANDRYELMKKVASIN